MRLMISLMIGLMISSEAWALIPQPPVINKELDVGIQRYLQVLFDNHNVLTTTTTIPNLVRVGKKGEIIVYVASSAVLYININGEKAWCPK